MSTTVGLGFNGELHESDTCWQLLGNGYRAYNPVLMRFHSADNLSPFEKGGPHSYAYCGGDPQNKADPSGHFAWGWLGVGSALAVAAGAITVAAVADHKAVKGVFATVVALAFVGAGVAFVGYTRQGNRLIDKVLPANPARNSRSGFLSPSDGSIGDRSSLRSVSGASVDSDLGMAGQLPAVLPGQNPLHGRVGRAPSSRDSGLGSISGGSTRSLDSMGSASTRTSSFRSQSSGSSIGLGQGPMMRRDGSARMRMLARGQARPGGLAVARRFDAENRSIRAL